MNSHRKTNDYVLSKELEEAIEIAEITQRPLLIRGEPGTGKTLLAEFVSKTKNIPIYKWHVKSTSIAKDGLYFYDAVSRLNDSRFADDDMNARVKNIDNYIRMGALGKAFSSPEKSVVLIDEIDKADIEFPNDLLLELDEMEFMIQETGKVIKATKRPFFIITSNNEKELPDAFLRRCIFHYIEFPNADLLKEIIDVHFPNLSKDFIDSITKMFYRLRRMDELKKKPTTSELLDWIQILLHVGTKLESNSTIPYLGALIKNEDDLKSYASKFIVR